MTQTFEDKVAALDLSRDADLFNRSVINMKRIAELMTLHTGNDPTIPSQKVLSEVYDLLFQVANPTGQDGRSKAAGIPEYPTEYLPTAMLKQLEARGALHPAGIGAGMLGCASASCMKARLLVNGTRRVIPALWVPSIGWASSGKSPASDIATKPFKDREEREVERYIREMLDWSKKTKAEKAGLIRPISDTLIVADTTAEALVRVLAGTVEGAVFMPDELASVLYGFGAWKKGDGQAADKTKLLELWTGSPWPYVRVGTGEDLTVIYIKQPVIPILGTIQPDYIRLLGDIGSGMQARWLPHLVGERVGQEMGYTTDVWTDTVNQMLTHLHTARTWTLDAGSQAMEEYNAAERRWEMQRKSVDSTPAMSSFLGKGGEHSLRLALVYAETEAAYEALDSPCVPRGGELPVWAVRAGIQMVDYCTAVWQVLGTTESGIALTYAEKAVAEKDDKLNAWLHGRDEKCATLSEIKRAKVAGCKTQTEVNALVERHKAIYGDQVVVAHRKNGFMVHAA